MELGTTWDGELVVGLRGSGRRVRGCGGAAASHVRASETVAIIDRHSPQPIVLIYLHLLIYTYNPISNPQLRVVGFKLNRIARSCLL